MLSAMPLRFEAVEQNLGWSIRRSVPGYCFEVRRLAEDDPRAAVHSGSIAND